MARSEVVGERTERVMPRASEPVRTAGPGESGVAANGDADGDVYTMTEAARLKGVSYHTVSRAVRRGKLPARRLGRMALIAAEDLRAWRPMRERAPRKYRRREPNPAATPALLDLASGERVDLARRLSTFYEVLHGAATELPLPEFLSLVCDRLATVLDFRRVAIWRINAEEGTATRVASFGPPFTDAPSTQPVADMPLLGQVLAREEAFVEPDVAALGPSVHGWQHVTSLFAAPLRIGDHHLGAVFGDCNGERFTLTTDQLWLAQGVANQAALALEQARLRQTESARAEQLAAILENVSEAVFAVDTAGRLTICNAACRSLLGLAEGSLELDRDALSAISRVSRRGDDGQPIPPEETSVVRALAGESSRDRRYVITPPDATVGRMVSISAQPIRRGEDVIGAVAVARDVTPEREAAQRAASRRAALEVEAAQAEDEVAALQALDLAKDEFLSVVAHELRNPLTSLRGNLQLLQRQVQRNEQPAEAERVGTILAQVDRMNALVNRLFDVSRAELGRLDISFVPDDAADIVRRAVEGAAGLSAAHTIVAEVEENEPVTWDGDRIGQVLSNLITNAVKYTPGGNVCVSLAAEDDRLQIAVRDYGPGVPDHLKARLFERYFRAFGPHAGSGREGDHIAEGLGLGLYISRQIARAHEGDLLVEDAADGGARFVLVLPRHVATSSAGAQAVGREVDLTR